MAGAFGQAPAPIGTPDPFGSLSKVLPSLGASNTAAGNTILAQLGGQLSPSTMQQIQNGAATFSAGTGMPGSNASPGTFGYNKSLESLGLTAEGQQNKGISNYDSFVPTVNSTQTVSPNLNYEIGAQNAIDAAAPDPASAANYAQTLYEHYLQSFGGNSKIAQSQTQQPGAFRYNPTTGGQPGSASYSSGNTTSPLSPPGSNDTVGVANGPAGQTLHDGSVVSDSNLAAWLKQTYGINSPSPSSGSGGQGSNPNDDPSGNGD